MSEQTAIVHAPTKELEIPDYRKVFTNYAIQLVRANKCPTASDVDFAAMMTVAAMRNLNPMTGQIHFVKRRSKIDGEWVDRWTYQVGIDGFRAIAARTGQYNGQDEPVFEYREEDSLKRAPLVAKVKVYRKGVDRPAVGVAHYHEYVQLYNDKPNHMWADKPHVMLAKCAEALAFRKLFPEEMGDLYIPEEMQATEDDGAVKQLTGVKIVEAPHQKAAGEFETYRQRILDCADLDALEAIGTEIAGCKTLSKTERDTLNGVYRAKRVELTNAPAKPAEPCNACDMTGSHAKGCPNNAPAAA